MRLVLPADGMSGKYLLTFALFIGNWGCVWWGYPHSIAGQLWSVSIEEQFYLSWPWILRRWANHLVVAACALLAAAFTMRVWLVFHGAVHPQIWCNTLARLDPIACGAVLAVYTQRRPIALPVGARVVLAAAGFSVLATLGQFGDFTGTKALITYPVGTLACMALLIATLGIPVPAANPFVYFGQISYGLYVFHLMFIDVFSVATAHDPLRRFARICGALAATTLVAACSYKFLEQPFLRLKAMFSHISTVRLAQ